MGPAAALRKTVDDADGPASEASAAGTDGDDDAHPVTTMMIEKANNHVRMAALEHVTVQEAMGHDTHGKTHLAKHLVRCSAWLALLVVSVPWPPLSFLVMAGLFFSTFALFHDAAHGALGLPQWVNDVLLMATSVPLFMSNHAQRQHHLRHHAKPLEEGDLEGQGAMTSLSRALWEAPFACVHMRVQGFVVVNDRVRRWVIVENLLNALTAVVVVLWGNDGVQAAFVMMVLLQITMNAWASHIPHRAPRWLLELASLFAWTGSPVVLSLVYHLEHHAHPRVPCALLREGLDVQSPLLEANKAREQPLPWAQLQPTLRPRPRRLRGMA